MRRLQLVDTSHERVEGRPVELFQRVRDLERYHRVSLPEALRIVFGPSPRGERAGQIKEVLELLVQYATEDEEEGELDEIEKVSASSSLTLVSEETRCLPPEQLSLFWPVYGEFRLLP